MLVKQHEQCEFFSYDRVTSLLQEFSSIDKFYLKTPYNPSLTPKALHVPVGYYNACI